MAIISMVQFILWKTNGRIHHSISVSNLETEPCWVLSVYLRKKVDEFSTRHTNLRTLKSIMWIILSETGINDKEIFRNVKHGYKSLKTHIFKKSKVTEPKDTNIFSQIIPNTLTKEMNFIMPRLFLKIFCLFNFFTNPCHLWTNQIHGVRELRWGICTHFNYKLCKYQTSYVLPNVHRSQHHKTPGLHPSQI